MYVVVELFEGLVCESITAGCFEDAMKIAKRDFGNDPHVHILRDINSKKSAII